MGKRGGELERLKGGGVEGRYKRRGEKGRRG